MEYLFKSKKSLKINLIESDLYLIFISDIKMLFLSKIGSFSNIYILMGKLIFLLKDKLNSFFGLYEIPSIFSNIEYFYSLFITAYNYL